MSIHTNRNSVAMMEQISAITSYAKQQLNEELDLCVYSNGSIMIKTKAGRGFGFDGVTEFYKNLGNYRK